MIDIVFFNNYALSPNQHAGWSTNLRTPTYSFRKILLACIIF